MNEFLAASETDIQDIVTDLIWERTRRWVGGGPHGKRWANQFAIEILDTIEIMLERSSDHICIDCGANLSNRPHLLGCKLTGNTVQAE